MDFLQSSLQVLISPVSFAVTGALFLVTYLFYQWLLPKPIKGVPYNKDATKSIFGDIPSMLAHLKAHTEFQSWILNHNEVHKSPIVQIFIDLFRGPVVIISDAREVQVCENF